MTHSATRFVCDCLVLFGLFQNRSFARWSEVAVKSQELQDSSARLERWWMTSLPMQMQGGSEMVSMSRTLVMGIKDDQAVLKTLKHSLSYLHQYTCFTPLTYPRVPELDRIGRDMYMHRKEQWKNTFFCVTETMISAVSGDPLGVSSTGPEPQKSQVDMDGKVDLWEVMAYILGRKTHGYHGFWMWAEGTYWC